MRSWLCYLSATTRRPPVQTETALVEHLLMKCLVVKKVGESLDSGGSRRYLRRETHVYTHQAGSSWRVG